MKISKDLMEIETTEEYLDYNISFFQNEIKSTKKEKKENDDEID